MNSLSGHRALDVFPKEFMFSKSMVASDTDAISSFLDESIKGGSHYSFRSI